MLHKNVLSNTKSNYGNQSWDNRSNNYTIGRGYKNNNYSNGKDYKSNNNNNNGYISGNRNGSDSFNRNRENCYNFNRSNQSESWFWNNNSNRDSKTINTMHINDDAISDEEMFKELDFNSLECTKEVSCVKTFPSCLRVEEVKSRATLETPKDRDINFRVESNTY